MGGFFSAIFGPSDEEVKEGLRQSQLPRPLNPLELQQIRNDKERAHRNSFKGGKRRSTRRSKKCRGTKRQVR